MAQSTVGLGLERIRELGVSLLVINKGPERTLHLILERDHERVAGHWIGTAIEEKLHQLTIPREQHVLQRDGLNTRAVFDERFDHVDTPAVHSLPKGSVLLLLSRFVSGEQYNEAVEPGIHSALERSLLDRRRRTDRLARRNPLFDVVELAGATQRQQRLRFLDRETR